MTSLYAHTADLWTYGRAEPATGSVARKVNCETATLLGWGPAILLQLAHPLVAAGVAEHSIAVAHPERRLERLGQTIRAMLAITFGTEEEVARAAAAINRVHDRVHGVLAEATGPFPAGTPYSAHDPALLAWVHLTLLEMLPRAYELFVGPLTAEEWDRYCAEATGMGPLLGIPDALLPRDYDAFQRYMATMLEDGGPITVTPTARAIGRDIVNPPLGPVVPALGWVPAPLYNWTMWPAIGLLPPRIRREFGFNWGVRERLVSAWLVTAWRAWRPLIPTSLRWMPHARAADARTRSAS
jgi:uncharacterized protein (DUF2236 family)